MAKKTILVGALSPASLSAESPADSGSGKKIEPVLRRGRLCYAGEHIGVNGPVTVTPELLKLMAERYNRVKANPQNEHDYAPILVEHKWDVDSIKGRLLADLEVGSWLEPASEKEVATIEGTLRIDNGDAQEKVAAGVYNHLSLTFDDETGEIFEISFVAVEAARGAQLLGKGDKQMDFEKKYKSLSKKVKEKHAVRTASLSAIKQTVSVHNTEAAALVGQIAKLAKSARIVALKSQLRGLVRDGKMSLSQMNTIKVEEIAGYSPEAQKAVLSAYASAPVSPDFVQHGQSGADPVEKKTLKMTPAQLRKAIKAQKLGKKAPLAQGEESSEENKNEAAQTAQGQEGYEGGESGDDKKPAANSELGLEDMEELLKALESMPAVIEKLTGFVKQMGGQVDQLSAEKDEVEGDEE